MKNKIKFLMSALVMTLLVVGFVSPVIGVKPTTSSGKETFELGYDCYHQPYTSYYDCKQVEHKRSWFEKKDFRIWSGWCTWIDNKWVCHYTWYRPTKA